MKKRLWRVRTSGRIEETLFRRPKYHWEQFFSVFFYNVVITERFKELVTNKYPELNESVDIKKFEYL